MSKFNSDLQIGDITDVYERLKSVTPGGGGTLYRHEGLNCYVVGCRMGTVFEYSNENNCDLLLDYESSTSVIETQKLVDFINSKYYQNPILLFRQGTFKFDVDTWNTCEYLNNVIFIGEDVSKTTFSFGMDYNIKLAGIFENITFNLCEFNNDPSSSGQGGEIINDVEFNNCSFNTVKDTMFVIADTGTTNVTFNNCELTSNPTTIFYITNNCKLTLNNTYIRRNGLMSTTYKLYNGATDCKLYLDIRNSYINSYIYISNTDDESITGFYNTSAIEITNSYIYALYLDVINAYVSNNIIETTSYLADLPNSKLVAINNFFKSNKFLSTLYGSSQPNYSWSSAIVTLNVGSDIVDILIEKD